MTRTDLVMNPAEYQSLLSERSSLERMIADTPPDDVIDLRSLQVRLEIVNDQLAAQPKETRLIKGESEMSDTPEAQSMVVFNKHYRGEYLCDVARDVSEAFDEDFNALLKRIPHDRHGFLCGRFDIKITWHQEEIK